jgi:hypothetical protein
MPRRTAEEESWDEDWEGDDWDDDRPEQFHSDDETPTVACPHCKRDIPEDTPRCPYCENYISTEEASPVRKPVWIIIGSLLVMFIVYCRVMKPWR